MKWNVKFTILYFSIELFRIRSGGWLLKYGAVDFTIVLAAISDNLYVLSRLSDGRGWFLGITFYSSPMQLQGTEKTNKLAKFCTKNIVKPKQSPPPPQKKIINKNNKGITTSKWMFLSTDTTTVETCNYKFSYWDAVSPSFCRQKERFARYTTNLVLKDKQNTVMYMFTDWLSYCCSNKYINFHSLNTLNEFHQVDAKG